MWGPGTGFWAKKYRSKISWHCRFKSNQTSEFTVSDQSLCPYRQPTSAVLLKTLSFCYPRQTPTFPPFSPTIVKNNFCGQTPGFCRRLGFKIMYKGSIWCWLSAVVCVGKMAAAWPSWVCVGSHGDRCFPPQGPTTHKTLPAAAVAHFLEGPPSSSSSHTVSLNI